MSGFVYLGSDFVARYAELGRAAGRRGPWLVRLDLQSWKGFVDSCEEGYDDVFAEYVGDRLVRDFLQKVLTDHEIRECAGFILFKDAVKRADERFRSIATTPLLNVRGSSGDWWNKFVPSYGGEDFARSLIEGPGVHIEVLS